MTTPDLIIGLDPGASGGVAILCHARPPEAWKMPVTERDLYEAMEAMWRGSKRAFLEKVHAMPGQGVSSTFKFGMSYGSLRMALIAAGIPFDEVAPAKWQRAMGIPPVKGEGQTAHKNRTKARAQELFPDLKITHATADALLIAAYGLRLLRGELSA